MKERLFAAAMRSCRLPTKRLAGIFLAAFLPLWGCAATGNFKQVEFTAPVSPDPSLRPLLDGVERMGVMCMTNIEPLKELDIEKVVTRLSDAIARRLGELPGVVIVPQDEIVWRFKGFERDSATVVTQQTRAALLDTLELDALILVELEDLQARMTPMTPTPYGMAPDPGLDMAVEMRVSLVNLHSGRIWQQRGQQRDWQPIRLQLFGGNPQGERQLIMALSGPLERFLLLVTPPPRTQVRHFELSGN